jgi:predicted permease
MNRYVEKIRALFRKEERDRDMTEEMRFHLDQRVAENVEDGMSAEDARHASQRKFGGVEQLKERCRDERMRGFVWLEHAWQDLRYAIRSLRKSPGFAIIVVFSVALGVGANTAVFSLLNDFLLRALPVKNPQELILFRYFRGEGGLIARATEGNGGKDAATGRTWHGSFSLPMFERFRAYHPGLSDIFAYAPLSQPNVLIDGQPDVTVSGQLVSGNYHDALGVSALIGRMLTENDDRASAEPVAVISHRYWQNRFAGDPAVLGKSIHLNQVPVTIVGVTPPGFEGTMQAGQSIEVSVPLGLFSRFYPERTDKLQPWFWWLHIMGRLAPGATAEQVRGALEPVFHEASREAWDVRPRPPGSTAGAMPGLPMLASEIGARGENDKRREYAKSLHLLMGLVGFVLLAACANVANLLLARGANRRREIAVRLALGASRSRIVRQLLAESLLLAFFGSVLGTLLASWSRDLLLALRPFGGTTVELDLPLDHRVLGFTLVVTCATALLFGLVPALRATRLNVSAEFQGGTRSLGGVRSRLSDTLMVVQIALSMVLLVCTGLFVRTLRNLQNVDAGFNRSGLVLFRIEAATAGYKPDQFMALHTRLQARFKSIPGVSEVTFSDIELVSGRRMGRGLTVPGYTQRTGQSAGAYYMTVAANFFPTVEMPLLLGRGFNERDDANAPKVAVVNQTFARKFFGDENAIGRRFSGMGSTGPGNEIEIVGIARDAKYTNLRDESNATLYTPLAQEPNFDGVANYAIRIAAPQPGESGGNGALRAVMASLPAAVRDIDARLPIRNLRTQDEQIDRLNSQPILFARLSGFFGALALGLACVGLYGLMSYNVFRRTGEIGLRMALGALPGRVLAMILREALALICIGIIAGLGLAVAAGRLIATMLFGLSPVDPVTYGAVAVGLIAVALIAALLPARRAAKVDPMTALRAE